jgi:lysyl-tRNA synthetase class II
LKSKEWKRWDTVMTIYNNNRYFLELYKTFRDYKKNSKLKAEFPKFFLSELYNRRTLKYNVISLPEGLPKIKFTEEEMAYQGASKRNKDKYDRPIKKRQLKRESKAGSLTSDPHRPEKEKPIDPNATPPASDENQPPPEGEQPPKDGAQ